MWCGGVDEFDKQMVACGIHKGERGDLMYNVPLLIFSQISNIMQIIFISF